MTWDAINWKLGSVEKDEQKKSHRVRAGFLKSLIYKVFLAEWTGLEPATPGVTGRYSNQLNYHSIATLFCRCRRNQVLQNLATLRGFEPRYSP